MSTEQSGTGHRTPETTSTPDFSLIVTCYFEENSIEEFYARLSATAETLGRSYEIVMVNDGSTDRTFEFLCDFFDRDHHVTTVVDLFQNAGQLAGMTAGLTHASGKAFVFIDSDLQLDPEDLPVLVEEFDGGADIVSGVRMQRKDPLHRRMFSKIANLVMRRVARHNLTDFGCTFKIFDAKLVRAFGFGPCNLWSTAYVFSQAGRCVEVPVSHHARRYRQSGWTVMHLLSFYMDHVVGLTYRPFQALSVACVAFAVLLFARIFLSWTLPFSVLSEVTTGLILNAILLSLLSVLAVLAAIGEYVIRIFVTGRRYPAYVIRSLRQRPASVTSVSTDPLL